MTPRAHLPLFPCSPRALTLPPAVIQGKLKLSIAGRGSLVQGHASRSWSGAGKSEPNRVNKDPPKGWARSIHAGHIWDQELSTGMLLVSPGDPQADSPGPHFTELCQVARGRESPQGGRTRSRLGELA